MVHEPFSKLSEVRLPILHLRRLGPYEILSAIGAGGMGEVYKARDTRLDRIVAIKVLPTHLADLIKLRELFTGCFDNAAVSGKWTTLDCRT
jgi:serine/threonine protein kinase